jgi:hypothetical protein
MYFYCVHVRLISAVLTVASILLLPLPVSSRPEELLYGTWRLDLQRSSYGERPPFRRVTFRVAPQEDGVRITYDTVGLRGGVIHLEWNGKFDGRDYIVQGVDQYVTNAYRQIDDLTYENVVRVDGRLTATTRITISPDRRTVTSVSTESMDGQTRTVTTVWQRLE